MRKRLTLLALAALLTLGAAPALANSQIIIVNLDPPGTGLNDPTPRAPVGGNPGTTLGQQRMNVFMQAASIWSNILDSAVPIRVQASFTPLGCTPTSGTLGATSTLAFFRDFTGALVPNTWYHVSLANRLAFTDLSPLPPIAPGFPTDDLITFYNSNIGLPGCLTGLDFYLGFDGNHGTNLDFLTILLHEYSHGLGFSSTASKGTGALLAGFPDTYLLHLYDNRQGLHWVDMTNAQRVTSIQDYGRVAWDGSHVTAAVSSTLAPGAPDLKINSSPVPLPPYTLIGPAIFGAPLNTAGVTGDLVQALDAANAAGPTTFDACTALTNAAAVAGKIAVVDRGTCGFIVKVKNAQDAGAIAVVVADTTPGSPPAGLGGADPTITIPSARVATTDGIPIKAAMAAGTVNVTLGLNLGRRNGADHLGRALLYTPIPIAGGSSISHWDVSATPNLLMEPFINADLTHNVDLTLPLFRDIGWGPDEDLDGVLDDADACHGSNLAATVVVGGCNSGVANTLFTNGCTISDLIAQIASGAGTHGDFVSGVAHLTDVLKAGGVITGAQKGTIQSCSAGASIP